jgi:hypothetical protein
MLNRAKTLCHFSFTFTNLPSSNRIASLNYASRHTKLFGVAYLGDAYHAVTLVFVNELSVPCNLTPTPEALPRRLRQRPHDNSRQEQTRTAVV